MRLAHVLGVRLSGFELVAGSACGSAEGEQALDPRERIALRVSDRTNASTGAGPGRPTIRALERGDRPAWQPLWDGYNAFYRHAPTAEVTDAAFSRLCSEADGFFALVAVGDDAELVGLAHAVLHPSTWTTARYCYLEDLFVARTARGGGVGQALIEAVYGEADARGAVRVYWHTQLYNAPARSLYDEVARATSFVVYER
jgi:GNAT superfamily N-acetyltransferase